MGEGGEVGFLLFGCSEELGREGGDPAGFHLGCRRGGFGPEGVVAGLQVVAGRGHGLGGGARGDGDGDIVGEAALVVDGLGQVIGDADLVVDDELDVVCAGQQGDPRGPRVVKPVKKL